jgi:glycosyltransferase involved in cell wall biosynthesis
VHAHFAYIPADVGMTMASLIGTGFSLSVHAWDIYTQPAASLARRAAAADFTVACTQHGYSTLARALPGEAAHRLFLIRHGLPLDKFVPSGEREPLVLGVGRLEPKKGFSHLVRACKVLKERGLVFHCRIAGAGSQERTLGQMVESLDLSRSVTLAGELTQEELLPLYARASVLAAPSVETADGDRDGVPNVALEALAMGVPVVGTTGSALPEVVADGVNGFIVPAGNPVALADRIAALLHDAGLRREMGERGRQDMDRDFNVSKSSASLAGLFRTQARGRDRQIS